jgi:hypothetical protein
MSKDVAKELQRLRAALAKSEQERDEAILLAEEHAKSALLAWDAAHVAEQERDEWRAKALDAERHPAVVALQSEKDALTVAYVDATRERAALKAEVAEARAALAVSVESCNTYVADNAALVGVVRLVAGSEDGDDCDWCRRLSNDHAETCIVSLALAQPHPGAALLEELVRLRECARLAAEHGAACAIARISETEQHQKDLAEARHADDNVKAFADAICSTIEHAELLASTPKGGQSVPNHNDFAHVPPSTRGQLRWWAKCGRAALKGERSPLLVRARNEGLERAAQTVFRELAWPRSSVTWTPGRRGGARRCLSAPSRSPRNELPDATSDRRERMGRMTTKAGAFWKALDDLSPEDRESIGNAARAMLEELAGDVNEAVCEAGLRCNIGLIDRSRLGVEAARGVISAVRP